jgi:DNA-binding transcriptional regulator LsrR (DeoR family)
MSGSLYRESLITVAKLYYQGNLSQVEIAGMMGLSRPKVSRMLKDARQRKIVQFSVATPSSHYRELERKIEDAFSMKKVIVVPTEPSHEVTKKQAGRAGAEYLASIVKDGDIIGLTWGSSTGHLIRHIPQLNLSGVQVYQLSAAVPEQSFSLDGHELTKRLATALNADYHVLNSPFIVNSALLKQLLMEEPQIKNHFERIKQMDVALVGLGSSDPALSVTYMSGYITLEESHELVRLGCAADICGHRILENGKLANIPLNERVISIELDTLRKAPNVIAVACGEDKVVSMGAALRGKWVNTLVTDEIAAIALITKLGL